MVLRDASDNRYPSTNGKMLNDGNFLWLPCYSKGIGVLGLRMVVRHHFAYYKHSEGQWDFASGVNLTVPDEGLNPWYRYQVG